MFIHDELFLGNCDLGILRMIFLPTKYDCRNVHNEFCYFANHNCKNHPNEFLFLFTHYDYKMFFYDEFFFAKCPFMINFFTNCGCINPQDGSKCTTLVVKTIGVPTSLIDG
jgi:hypothetical protein